MSILEDMYYGDLESPQRPAMYWQEIRDIDQQISRIYKELLPELTEKQRKLCDDVEKLLAQKSMIDACYSFRNGFRLAAHIFAEALTPEQ